MARIVLAVCCQRRFLGCAHQPDSSEAHRATEGLIPKSQSLTYGDGLTAEGPNSIPRVTFSDLTITVSVPRALASDEMGLQQWAWQPTTDLNRRCWHSLAHFGGLMWPTAGTTTQGPLSAQAVDLGLTLMLLGNSRESFSFDRNCLPSPAFPLFVVAQHSDARYLPTICNMVFCHQRG